MVRKRSRKTSFRKKYPSLLSLIKKGVRSLFAVLLLIWKNLFKILLALLLIFLAYKVYSFLYSRYLEDKRAYSSVQAERDADTRAVEAAARRDNGEEYYAEEESEPVEWPVSKDVSPDCKPIWPRVETAPLPLVSVVARELVDEMTENVIRRQQ